MELEDIKSYTDFEAFYENEGHPSSLDFKRLTDISRRCMVSKEVFCHFLRMPVETLEMLLNNHSRFFPKTIYWNASVYIFNRDAKDFYDHYWYPFRQWLNDRDEDDEIEMSWSPDNMSDNFMRFVTETYRSKSKTV